MMSDSSKPTADGVAPSIIPATSSSKPATGDTVRNSTLDSVVSRASVPSGNQPLVSLTRETGIAEQLELFSIATHLSTVLDPVTVASHNQDSDALDSAAANALISRQERLLSELKAQSQPDEWYCFSRLFLKRQSLQQLSAEMNLSEQGISSLISRMLQEFQQRRSAKPTPNPLLCWGLASNQLQQLAEHFPELQVTPQLIAPRQGALTPLVISSIVEQEFLEWHEHQESHGEPLPPTILFQSHPDEISLPLQLKISGIVTPGNWTRLRQLLDCSHLQASEGTAAEAVLFMQFNESLELQCSDHEWLPPAFWRICEPQLADHIRGCQPCRRAALTILQTHASSAVLTDAHAAHEVACLDDLWDDPDDSETGVQN